MGVTLSICLPTHNRGALLADRVRTWLAAAPDDFEIVVSDNASDNGTYEALSAVRDLRFTLVRNETDVGSFENQLRAFEAAHGRYVMQLMDKDELVPAGIEAAVAALRSADAACGEFELNRPADARSALRRESGYRAFARHGLAYAHPSGRFFNAGLLSREGLLARLRALDPVIRPFSTDYLVSLCLPHGDYLVAEQPFVKHNLPPYEGVARSFSYTGRRTFYFMPDFIWREFTAYVAFLRTLGALSGTARFALAVRLVRRVVFPHVTSIYRWVLGERTLREWYGIPDDLYRAELARDLEGDFFKHACDAQDLTAGERLAVRLAASCCRRRARKQRKEARDHER